MIGLQPTMPICLTLRTFESALIGEFCLRVTHSGSSSYSHDPNFGQGDLLRDRDAVYGTHFRRRVAGFQVTEVLIAPRSPWQNPYVERLIGSVRRECLDHVIVLGEAHLRRVLSAYFAYYQRSRTHLSLDRDAPNPGDVQPPAMGEVIELPEVGGLHHRYERWVA